LLKIGLQSPFRPELNKGVKIHEKHDYRRPDSGTSVGVRIGGAEPRGGHHHHLQGRNHQHLYGQGHVQRSWRRAEGGSGRGSRSRSDAGAEGNRDAQSAQHLRRWHDLNLNRQGYLQRSWRSTEGREIQTGNGGNDSRTGRCCDAGRHGPCRGACGCVDHRGQVIDGDQIGADGHRRQYGSDGCDCEVQGRHLFEIRTSQRNLLQPRRRS
jgi:hypothetical protein